MAASFYTDDITISCLGIQGAFRNNLIQGIEQKRRSHMYTIYNLWSRAHHHHPARGHVQQKGVTPHDRLAALCSVCNNNNNNNCLKSNIQCIEIRVQWTVHLGSSHMHVHAVTRVHAVTPKLVICVMYLTSI